MKCLISALFICFCFSCKENNKVSPVEKTNNLKTEKNNDIVLMQAEITCPHCGFSKNEPMPTEVCLIKYTCTQCETDLFPKDGDCCVFCTYSPVRCPSMQEK